VVWTCTSTTSAVPCSAPWRGRWPWGARILPIGFTSGEIPSLAMNLPLLKNYSAVGCYWGA